VLGHGEVEGNPLGMMVFVRTQQMAELIVWCAFSDSRWWYHDKYPMYKFVVVSAKAKVFW
jgi:hypothetical protein